MNDKFKKMLPIIKKPATIDDASLNGDCEAIVSNIVYDIIDFGSMKVFSELYFNKFYKLIPIPIKL